MLRLQAFRQSLRFFTLVMAFMLGSGVVAPAQQLAGPPLMPAHLTVASEVLKASGLMTMFANFMPNVVGTLRTNVTRTRPELTKDLEEALKIVEAEMPNVTNDGISGAARFLAARMSEGELRDTLTFLTSSAGKKYVETLPGFMDEVVPFMQAWSANANQLLTRKFIEEMAKRGHRL